MDKKLINKYYSGLKHNNYIESNKFLSKILNKIPKNITNEIEYNIEKFSINELDQPKYITSDFISSKITDYILEEIKYHYNIIVKYNKLTLNLNFYSGNREIDMVYFGKIIRHILLFYKMYKSSIDIMDISIYDTPFKKSLENTSKITTYNINSGYSIPYVKQIIIYRREELLKVLIHELLHIFQFKIREEDSSCGMFCDLYSIKTEEFLVNESIVELYGIIYNSILLSLSMYNKINRSKIIEILNIELEFNLYQTAKILKFSRFDNIEEFLCNCTNKYIMEEKTNIVSYIIIKTLILFNINKLDKYDVLEDRKLIEIIIAKYFKDKKYKNIINYYINDITKNGMIDYNLRMSLFS